MTFSDRPADDDRAGSGSAKRLMERLLRAGWRARFTANGARVEEAVENYRALGFEVKTVPFKDLKAGECTICFEDENDATVMIFTRETQTQSADDEHDAPEG